MPKENAPRVALTLRKFWSTIGKTKVIPRAWLEGTIVPLFKGKGAMNDPLNFRFLCILSHTRKIVEKAVVMELEKLLKTDQAQFAFQAGIQIEKALLRVAAMIRKGINFILVLDLSKAYETVLKALVIEKLKEIVPVNLVNKLRVFIKTVTAKVTGDITNTIIQMKRGLTQGGTSSPPLLKVFINYLPSELRRTLIEKFPNILRHDPEILVADDILALSVTIQEMQAIADA